VAETLQEILTRFEGKIANSGGQDRAGESGRGPICYPTVIPSAISI
jgi:hypothetical protein